MTILITDTKAMHEWYAKHRHPVGEDCPECHITPGQFSLHPHERLLSDGRCSATLSPESWLNQQDYALNWDEALVTSDFYPVEYRGFWSRMEDGSWAHNTPHYYLALESARVVYKDIRDIDGKVLAENTLEAFECKDIFKDSVSRTERCAKYIVILEGEEISVGRREFASHLFDN